MFSSGHCAIALSSEDLLQGSVGRFAAAGFGDYSSDL
jgi:hypothetical protein